MKDWKKISKKLLFPPIWMVLILGVISAASLVIVFAKGWDNLPISYVVYVISFYTLTVFCIACSHTFPAYYKSVKGKVYANKYANRYLTDAAFKTHVSLYRSLAINLLYAAVNGVSAIIYSTNWFAIFSVYYFIMAVMRFLLVRYINRNAIGKSRLGEWKRSRACAIILMTVNLALSGAVLMMVYFERGFEYQGILIYVMAMYTFYITTAAVRDIIRYRKYNSPVMTTSMVIKLAAALVSMLSLETAMLSQFGSDSSPEMRRTMIIATGAGISIIVVTMSIYLIVRATKEIKNEITKETSGLNHGERTRKEQRNHGKSESGKI